MKKLSHIILVSFLSLTTKTALAANFEFQNIRVGGTGCPSEVTQIIFAPDKSSASIIFSQFAAVVPTNSTNPKVPLNIANHNCNMFLDIKIPLGVKLESLEVSYDMRGFATLDRGVVGSFKSFLVSKNGLGLEGQGRGAIETIQEKIWSNSSINQEEDFTISTSKTLRMPSTCARSRTGDTVTIRLQHTLESRILAGFERVSTGSITMDTSDIKGGLNLKAITSFCGNIPNNPPGNGNGRNCRIVRENGRAREVCI